MASPRPDPLPAHICRLPRFGSHSRHSSQSPLRSSHRRRSHTHTNHRVHSRSHRCRSRSRHRCKDSSHSIHSRKCCSRSLSTRSLNTRRGSSKASSRAGGIRHLSRGGISPAAVSPAAATARCRAGRRRTWGTARAVGSPAHRTAVRGTSPLQSRSMPFPTTLTQAATDGATRPDPWIGLHVLTLGRHFGVPLHPAGCCPDQRPNSRVFCCNSF
mmetsp:Transcript_15565/g.46971  ORF Transcript_15565/g.46971 Transcript_15565/m.46971 type:complete len:214 (+) Transcript_15565:3688-4329(+)